MGGKLWDYDKFWVIWSSCLDKPRTLKEIQEFWGYDGNALYQKGVKKPIWKEMVEQGFIETKGKVKVRGVVGDLIYGKMEWIEDYLEEVSRYLRVKLDNDQPFQLLKCIKNKKKLFYFIDTHRSVFYLLPRLKILFGEKETLRANAELCITAPIITTFNYYIIGILSKKLKLELDSVFLLSQPLIFTPYFRVNFLGYYKLVIKELSLKELPLDIFDEATTFKLWKDYAKQILRELNL